MDLDDIHLYCRGAKESETALGGAIFHRGRIARLTIDSGTEAANSAWEFI